MNLMIIHNKYTELNFGTRIADNQKKTSPCVTILERKKFKDIIKIQTSCDRDLNENYHVSS